MSNTVTSSLNEFLHAAFLPYPLRQSPTWITGEMTGDVDFAFIEAGPHTVGRLSCQLGAGSFQRNKRDINNYLPVDYAYLGNAMFFTKFYLALGYHQISFHKDNHVYHKV